MMLLKNAFDIGNLLRAIDKCEGDVILRSADGTETFNLKSTLSKYIAVGELCKDQGDQWEIFCMNKNDEHYMLTFFKEINN